jgi:hypothetical protein
MSPELSLVSRVLAAPVLALSLATAACLDLSDVGTIERQVEHEFSVTAGSSVNVRLTGGGITANAGPAGTVRVRLRQRIAADSDAEADRALAEYEISVVQDGNQIQVLARPKNRNRLSAWSQRVHVSAAVIAPPDARLDLETSGGGIVVRGDRQGTLRAATSGGGIDVDGGAGQLELDTSGGGITVGRALTSLSADTSGGGITVRYVGAQARDVALGTSGGGIRVGVDPAASLAVDASTSGGGVRIDGLPFTARSMSRSSAQGSINAGAGRLRAGTSGGGITVQAATAPED